MKKSKNGIEGITLIALVVTIIVLLILAGVTMNLLLGNNGIINRTNEAKTTYIKEAAREEVNLGWADVNTQRTLGELTKLPEERLQEILRQKDGNATVTRRENQLDIFFRGYDFVLEDEFTKISKIKDALRFSHDTIVVVDNENKIRVATKKEKIGDMGYAGMYTTEKLEDMQIVPETAEIKAQNIYLCNRNNIYCGY